MSNPLKRAVADFLAANAFTDIAFDHAGGHQTVRATRAGRTATVRFSSTPSDSFFAAKKVIADIRRAFSIPAHSHRAVNRISRTANKAGVAARPAFPYLERAPVIADPRDGLAEIRAQLFGGEA